MTRYILIDSNSGYVWGDTQAADPAAACRAVDEEFMAYGRTYAAVYGARALDGVSGYFVYEAPASFPDVTDGAQQRFIEAVERLPLVARVAFRDPRDEDDS
jgi:hypothetical protein